MIRRIAFQYENGIPVETVLSCLDSHGTAINNYADLSRQIKGLPMVAEYNEVYSWYLPYDQQLVYPCRAIFSPREFVETASDVLKAIKCRTVRLEHYQIFENDQLVTEKSHLGMADLSGNTAGSTLR